MPQLFCLIFVIVSLGAGYVLGARTSRSEEPKAAYRFGVDSYLLILLVATCVGAGLRFYGITFGLPYPFHPDEYRKALVILTMARRDTFDPNYFRHPTMLMYFSWAMADFLHVLGVFANHGPARAILGGRLVSAIAGTISIPLLFLLGRQLFSRFTGVWAAMMLAVFPIHVTASRYLKEDALLTMFLILTALLFAKAVQERKIAWIYAAGLAAGLTMGSKYSGIVVAPALFAGPWLVSGSIKPDRRFLLHTIASMGCVVLGFLISTPYSVITPNRFIHEVMVEQQHAANGHAGVAIDAWSQLWMFHLSGSLIPGTHVLTLCIALIGLGIFLKQRSWPGLLVVALFLLFYLPAEFAKSKPMPQPERYVLPCAAFLALAAAEACRRLQSRQATALVVLCAMLPLVHSVQLAKDLVPDTRQRMTRWVRENIPEGSRILTMGGGVYLSKFPKDRYYVRSARRVIGKEKQEIVKRLKGSGYDYLLCSSFPMDRFPPLPPGSPEKAKAYKAIETELQVARKEQATYGTYGFHNPTLTLYALK